MHNKDEHNLPFSQSLLGESSERIEMYVQECIYGHRFIKDQHPYMILLEALAVCSEVPLGKHKATSQSHEPISYNLKHRRRMRYIVFCDQSLTRILNSSTISDNAKWSMWKDIIARDYSGRSSDPDEFDYLDLPFDENLKTLHQVVQILHSHELDVPNNRRSSSKFLSIKGEDMICFDMGEAKKSWSPDRRFFGRGGELVYLMLNRSKYTNELNNLIQSKFLKTGNWVNKIAEPISNDPVDGSSRTHIGYLPLLEHKIYNQMAKDWYTILDINEAPSNFLFDPLFRITSLNLVEYFLRRSIDMSLGKNRSPVLVDATDGTNSKIRNLSKSILARQRKLIADAIRVYIDNRLKNCPNWKSVHNNGTEAKRILKDHFNWEGDSSLNPDSQLQRLISKATSRSRNNIEKCFLPLVKGIGLAGTRSGVGPWFNISDQMISALVLANVAKTCEFSKFTKKMYRKYGIVIGPEEARKAFKKLPIGVQCFEDNLDALERRMQRLSLTERLSDDCAFVTNPWRQEE